MRSVAGTNYKYIETRAKQARKSNQSASVALNSQVYTNSLLQFTSSTEWSHRESQNGRGRKGPLWIIQSNPPCRSRVTYSRLHRTLSRRVFNISREGNSTTSLGRLFQRFVTLKEAATWWGASAGPEVTGRWSCYVTIHRVSDSYGIIKDKSCLNKFGDLLRWGYCLGG